MLNGKLFCSIFKSAKKGEMYLYVDRQQGVSRVPEALLAHFGKRIHVTDMILSPDRPLARVDVGSVMREIRENGFYLQMPPPPDEDLYLAKGRGQSPRDENGTA